MAFTRELNQGCRELTAKLIARNARLVLAESCTAGLVAASLARIPGVSSVLCGSAVTYRDETKVGWLGVERRVLREHGAVCAQVARQMVSGALSRTPEANLAAAVTGHLGPNAPEGMDGLVFIAVGRRRKTRAAIVVNKNFLTARTRLARQQEASLHVVRELLKTTAKLHAC